MANITKTTILLFLLRVASMLVSVISVTVTAKFFGVSVEKDCWILALTLVTTIVMGMWGPLNEIFRAKFVFLREQEGLDKVLSMTSSLIIFIVVVTLGASLLVAFFYKEISSVIIGNISSNASEVFATLLLALIPTILLTELTKITTSILNAFDVFYIPDIVGLFCGIINVILIISLTSLIGIYSLLCGTYVSTVLLLVVNSCYLNKKEIRVWTGSLKFDFNYVKPFLIYALPFFLPYFVGQLNGIAEKYIAALLGQGAVSSLDYASQFTKILQSVISGILTTVMVPILAKAFANNRMDEFSIVVKDNIRVCMLILIAFCGLLIGAAEPICHFFFDRGRVDTNQLLVIIDLTRAYGLTFMGIFLYLIFGFVLLSYGKGKIYALAGVVTQLFVTLLFVVGFKMIGNLYVFPISVFIAHFLAAIWMMYIARAVFSFDLLCLLLYSNVILVLVSVVGFYVNRLLWINIDLLKILLCGCTIGVLLLITYVPLAYDWKNLKSSYTKFNNKWKKKRL